MLCSAGNTLTGKINRRDFLWLASVSTLGLITGCAANPVTGRQQLMFFSEAGEINLDRQNSPHQFSSDYGQVQDPGLNRYLAGRGSKLASVSHRPDMPYSFRCVNATYVNAYAFPGGSIATTRGILLELENEAELDALLGHEIAHVSARHTASRMSHVILAGVILAGAAMYLDKRHEDLAPIAAGLGAVATGALLARYSRGNEREADELGMSYMTRSGSNPQGMVGLMNVLQNLSIRKPSAIEMMFATHPMSEERLRTAQQRSGDEYSFVAHYPLHRERYMDSTANLRKIKGAIEKMQEGEKAMSQKKLHQAEIFFSQALHQAPNDYAGLVLMSKCQLALNRPQQARSYAERARRVYPSEAQAHHLSGMALMELRQYDAAFQQFDQYEKMLPGNANTIFLKGVCLERMRNRSRAAEEYQRYLNSVRSGDQADHARARLVEWGYVEP